MTSRYRGMCKIQHGKHAFVERACLLYTREMLAVSFDRLASQLFLVVGREIHGESFVMVSCIKGSKVHFALPARDGNTHKHTHIAIIGDTIVPWS